MHEGTTFIGLDVHKRSIAVAVRQDSPKLAAAVNKTLERLRTSGKMDERRRIQATDLLSIIILQIESLFGDCALKASLNWILFFSQDAIFEEDVKKKNS